MRHRHAPPAILDLVRVVNAIARTLPLEKSLRPFRQDGDAILFALCLADRDLIHLEGDVLYPE